MKWREKRDIPEKTHRPTALSGTIPTCENPVTRLAIEPDSPWWEASRLTTQPPCPLQPSRYCFYILVILCYLSEKANLHRDFHSDVHGMMPFLDLILLFVLTVRVLNVHLCIAADASVPSGTSLNTYIRDYAKLTATKFMCYEGGCGSCVVAVTAKHPATGVTHTYAVNSGLCMVMVSRVFQCLVHVFSCHGWSITTDEGIGNKKDGYHTIQSTLAHYSGTQCGYCSPGMVMNMYRYFNSVHRISQPLSDSSWLLSFSRVEVEECPDIAVAVFKVSGTITV
ncbi:hypothetical protein PR048_020315 [Dryococelus australis]|uniref:Uncharacterized protein n=1 Tax=Dryococelus australis TaxID=614101 RepID=A0ABQ9H5Y8_9NEOP|nr:hypothetical protein PR048_020315 [Dryococelus australis]